MKPSLQALVKSEALSEDQVIHRSKSIPTTPSFHDVNLPNSVRLKIYLCLKSRRSPFFPRHIVMSIVACTRRPSLTTPASPCRRNFQTPISVSIVFPDHRESSYRSGDCVSGLISVAVPENESLSSIAVIFSGTCNVVLTKQVGGITGHQGSAGCLFRYHRVLERFPAFSGGGRYTWPFSFDIPQVADSHLDGSTPAGEIFETRAPWTGSDIVPPHRLPPTMSYSAKNGNFTCNITYQLEARLVRPPSQSGGVCSVLSLTRELEVQTGANVYERGQPYCQERSLSLHAFYNVHLPGVGDSVRSMFSKPVCTANRSGPLSIELAVSSPRMVVLNTQHPLPISLSAFELDAPTKSGSAYSRVHLPSTPLLSSLRIYSLVISLLARTSIRVGSQVHVDRQKVLLTRSTNSVQVQIRSHTNRADTDIDKLRSTSLPVDTDLIVPVYLPSNLITPSFSTYNIARSYLVEVEVAFEYLGRKHKHTFNDLPIKIFNQPQLEASVGNQTPKLGHLTPFENWIGADEPPGYEA